MGRTMSKVSVLIPSRNEPHLARTIDDMLKKATGDVEIIAVIDGPSWFPPPFENYNVKIITFPEPMGMRHGVNVAATIATGKYIMKIDSHCIISNGYDVLLQSECDDDWVITAVRNELSADWVVTDTTPVDYFYMSNPWTSPQGYMRMSRWISRSKERKDITFDETMTISGSMWFMSRDHFFHRIRTMDDGRFGQWSGEPEELACKTWLGGGKMMIDKRIVYAHMRKDKIPQPYHIPWKYAIRGLRESARYWSNDEWPYAIHKFDWLIDHFWPLPSQAHHCNGEKYFWEDNWKNHG